MSHAPKQGLRILFVLETDIQHEQDTLDLTYQRIFHYNREIISMCIHW